LTTALEFILPFLTPEQIILLRPVSTEFRDVIDRYFRTYQPQNARMLTSYRGEDKLKQGAVTYFDEQQREKYKLRIDKNGFFYLGGSTKEFTSGAVSDASPLGQRFHLFAIAPDGTFYVHTKVPQKIHHSSMLAGGDVICAGFVSIKDGKLVSIFNSSGHYQPTIANVFMTIELLLDSHGIVPSSYEIRYSTGRAPKIYSTAIAFLDGMPVSLRILAKRLIPSLYGGTTTNNSQ